MNFIMRGELTKLVLFVITRRNYSFS